MNLCEHVIQIVFAYNEWTFFAYFPNCETIHKIYIWLPDPYNRYEIYRKVVKTCKQMENRLKSLNSFKSLINSVI
jgi:hypothetical protein